MNPCLRPCLQFVKLYVESNLKRPAQEGLTPEGQFKSFLHVLGLGKHIIDTKWRRGVWWGVVSAWRTNRPSLFIE